MPITIQEDLVEKHRLRITVRGKEMARIFQVRGLDPTRDTLLQAVSAVDSADATIRIPVYGSLHPDDQTIVVDQMDFEPFAKNSKTDVSVVVTYRSADFSSAYRPLLRFEATSEMITSNYDVDGNLIVVSYKESGAAASSSTSFGVDTVIGQVSFPKRKGLLIIERMEYQDPIQRLPYINTMNSDTYFGQSRFKWAIADIQIEKIGYTAGWKVTYYLEYDPKTHIKTDTYRDPITGVIPQFVDTNPDPMNFDNNTDGYKNVKVYTPAPFGPLGLPQNFSGT